MRSPKLHFYYVKSLLVKVFHGSLLFMRRSHKLTDAHLFLHPVLVILQGLVQLPSTQEAFKSSFNRTGLAHPSLKSVPQLSIFAIYVGLLCFL